MVVSGEVILVTDAGEAPMGPGDCAAFPAGDPDGHCFLNRSGAEARFLVVGTRAPREVATYSDVDLVATIEAGTAAFTRRDGRPYVPPEGA